MSLSTTTDNSGAKSREAVNQVALDAVLSANPLGRFFQTLMLWLASIFSLTVEMLLRRNFGERYLPLPAVTLSALVFFLLAQANRGPENVTFFTRAYAFFPSTGGLTWLFLLVFVAAGVFHRYVIFRRNWYTGPQWHSYAAGDSWLQGVTTGLRGRLPFMVPVTEATQRYIEPALVIFVGLVLLFTLDGFLGVWLILAGASLAIKEQLKHTTIRNSYLNLVDSQLEAQAMTDLLQRGWSELTPETDTNPAEKVRRNGYTAYIPIPTRTADQRQAAAATLEGMFPKEMDAARSAEGSRWQQAKARQQQISPAENSSTSPGTGDD